MAFKSRFLAQTAPRCLVTAIDADFQRFIGNPAYPILTSGAGEPCGGSDRPVLKPAKSGLTSGLPRVVQGLSRSRLPTGCGARGRGKGGDGLLQGVKSLGQRRQLLGKLFGLRLLRDELILNDLQLVDGLLLSYPKPLCRLQDLV